MRLSRLLAVAVAAACFAAVAPSAHAADYFMKVDGINGETAAQNMKGYIDIDSFDLGFEQVASTTTTGGIGAGKAKFNALTVQKSVDATTPQLFAKGTAGTYIGAIEIVGRKAATQTPFVRYCFQTALITKQEQSAASGDELKETLDFAFVALGQQYTRQNADGTPGTSVFAGWSVNLNRPFTPETQPATCTRA
jgi:type VI secretion system secreted protein Hcp